MGVGDALAVSVTVGPGTTTTEVEVGPGTGTPTTAVSVAVGPGSGSTVMVVEHNLDVIKTADSILDLGPEGGVRGGENVAEGTPEQVAANVKSFTSGYLKALLTR